MTALPNWSVCLVPITTRKCWRRPAPCVRRSKPMAMTCIGWRHGLPVGDNGGLVGWFHHAVRRPYHETIRQKAREGLAGSTRRPSQSRHQGRLGRQLRPLRCALRANRTEEILQPHRLTRYSASCRPITDTYGNGSDCMSETRVAGSAFRHISLG